VTEVMIIPYKTKTKSNNYALTIWKQSVSCPVNILFRWPLLPFFADFPFLFQFDLVCTVSALSVLNKAVMFLGYMIGVLVGGVLSDKFGRKPIVYFLSVLCNVIALGASFVQVYWLYVLLRCLVGVCVGT